MQLIQTVTVGSGGSASIVFSSIPQTFTDLLLVFSLRGTVVDVNNEVRLTINSSGGTDRLLYSFGSAGANSNASGSILRGNTSGGNATSNTFGSGSAYIPNYTSTNAKSVAFDTMSEGTAGNQGMYLNAGLPTSTAAVTQISLDNPSSFIWVQYSSASLYGILKGSSGGVTVS